MNNIYLIGMMGSGKTTIGRKLSKKLNMDFVDVDTDIEFINDRTILEIFNEFGENKFREMESAYFIEKSKEENKIFSTGGGIILRKKNREVLINHGLTFLLELDCNILLNRIKDIDNRPLLSGSDNLETIYDIWNQRKKYYYNSCHHIINVNNLSVKDAIEEIITILN